MKRGIFWPSWTATLSFAPDLFRKNVFQKISRKIPNWGLAAASPVRQNGAIHVESKGDPAFHVRGATKIYRHDCWRAIGGLLRETGWDTYDEVKANMLGWKTRTFNGLPLMHHRENRRRRWYLAELGEKVAGRITSSATIRCSCFSSVSGACQNWPLRLSACPPGFGTGI